VELEGAFGVHAKVFERGLLRELLLAKEGEGLESLSGGSDGEVALKEFIGIEAIGSGSGRGVEGGSGDFFVLDVDGGAFSDFEVEVGGESAEGFVARDLFADADLDRGEAGVEGLDDVAVGETVAEEDGFSGVTGGVARVEDESVTTGGGGGGAVEVTGGGKAEAFHGAELAEVGLEFSGPEFRVFPLVLPLDGDGIARDGVGFLREAEGVGIVLNGVLEKGDAQGHEDEPEKNHGGDDDVGAANLHGDTFRGTAKDRKPKLFRGGKLTG